MGRLWQFVQEMRRRRVFLTAAIYVVGAWVLLQVIALAFQSFGIPDAALQSIWYAAIAGFPLALIFGWRYDITPEGIVRTPPAGSAGATDLKSSQARLCRPGRPVAGRRDVCGQCGQ